MYAKLICDPPLGRPTIVPTEKKAVHFNVLVETSKAFNRTLKVALWHNFGDADDWESLSFTPVSEEPHILVGHAGANVQRHAFTTTLGGRPKHGGPLSFTIKFRTGGDEQWKWARDQFSSADGLVYYQLAESPTAELSSYLDGVDETLHVKEERSECPGSILWSVTGSVNAALGSVSGVSAYVLGKPLHLGRWFALVRLWSPWLAPRHGREEFQPDKDAVIASFLRTDGLHVVVLAISGVGDVLTIMQHDGQGHVVVRGRNDGVEEQSSTVLVAVSKDFEVANSAVMYHARKVVTSLQSTTDETSPETTALYKDDVKAKWLQEWYDGLTYCTWNGLGQKLTADRIYHALDKLKENGINITNLIIDDNWQSLNHEGQGQNHRGWYEFEADHKTFPEGLAKTVSRIRKRQKNISHIAVWHALLGYWGGIAPDGKIAEEYQTTEVTLKPGFTGGRALVVDAEDVPRMYRDFYTFLSAAGIDSVKTDAQFFLDELDDAHQRRRLTKVYQDTWVINYLRFFAAKAISCMSQAPQIIFRSQLARNKPRIMLRNSDDFFPDEDSSHPWHIFCNAHNALFTQHLNVLPDWDMFQTAHPWASFHAAARCVSGGPIYITDEPGKHDVDLIHQMTAKTTRGDTVILRPDCVGKSIVPYDAYDDGVLLKVGTYAGRQGTGTGILGVFNVCKEALLEFLALSAFPGTADGRYVVRAHTTGDITMSQNGHGNLAGVYVELPVRGWEILSAYPVHAFSLSANTGRGAQASDEISVANLGLIDKMTGAAAIVNTIMEVERNGRLSVWTSLKALGTFGLYVSHLKHRSLERDFMATVFGKPVPMHTVKVDSKRSVLSIDIEAAWNESDQRSRWSNEVAVQILIHANPSAHGGDEVAAESVDSNA